MKRSEITEDSMYHYNKQVMDLMDAQFDFQDKLNAEKRDKRNDRLTLSGFIFGAIALITTLLQ